MSREAIKDHFEGMIKTMELPIPKQTQKIHIILSTGHVFQKGKKNIIYQANPSVNLPFSWKKISQVLFHKKESIKSKL